MIIADYFKILISKRVMITTTIVLLLFIPILLFGNVVFSIQRVLVIILFFETLVVYIVAFIRSNDFVKQKRENKNLYFYLVILPFVPSLIANLGYLFFLLVSNQYNYYFLLNSSLVFILVFLFVLYANVKNGSIKNLGI